MGYKLSDFEGNPDYRYALAARTNALSRKVLVVIQCNPSKANNSRRDPTVGKVARWAEQTGFGRVVFLNLFALISPSRSILAGKAYDQIVGPMNDEILNRHLKEPDSTVVFAWGGGIPVPKHLYVRRLAEIKKYVQAHGLVPHHVGKLSYGTHPRHGRMWNKGNRDLRVLSWASIGA